MHDNIAAAEAQANEAAKSKDKAAQAQANGGDVQAAQGDEAAQSQANGGKCTS